MIDSHEQLVATLDYIAKWADIAEAMRQDEAEQTGGLFPTILEGPLSEIRTNIAEARAFALASRSIVPHETSRLATRDLIAA